MSVVTSYVLFTNDLDYSNVQFLNEMMVGERTEKGGYVRECDKFKNPTEPIDMNDGVLGGSKVCDDFWAAGMNHFPYPEMIGYIRDVDWNCPDEIHLMWKGDNDEQWNHTRGTEIFANYGKVETRIPKALPSETRDRSKDLPFHPSGG